MFIFRHNDGGRSKYYRGEAGDCGVRAIAIVTNTDYKEVYDGLRELTGKTPRNGLKRNHLTKYIEPLGWHWLALSGIGKQPVSVSDVMSKYPNCIMRVRKHFSAVVDGVNEDTWPQHLNKRVYGVWIKEKQ